MRLHGLCGCVKEQESTSTWGKEPLTLSRPFFVSLPILLYSQVLSILAVLPSHSFTAFNPPSSSPSISSSSPSLHISHPSQDIATQAKVIPLTTCLKPHPLTWYLPHYPPSHPHLRVPCPRALSWPHPSRSSTASFYLIVTYQAPSRRRPPHLFS